MPVRDAMLPLIDYIRQHGSAAQDDVFNGVTYWTNQQLQDILDNASERKSVLVRCVNTAETIFVPNLPRHYYPDTDEIVLYDSSGAVLAATYTYNLLRQELFFDESPNDLYYVEGAFVNMWIALADLWGEKAAQRHTFVQNKSGQNSLYMQQEYDHCVQRQAYYRNKFIKRWKR